VRFTLNNQHQLDSPLAPRKEFHVVKDAGHFALFMRPDRFLSELEAVLGPMK